MRVTEVSPIRRLVKVNRGIKTAFPSVLPDLTAPDPLPGVMFAYGSNEAGRNGDGAAKDARDLYRAVTGKGQGHSGDAYAIPTKDRNLKPLPYTIVLQWVAMFIGYAGMAIEMGYLDWFLVTRIGCERAGFTDAEIAPLFEEAPANCILPEAWKPYLSAATIARCKFHNRTDRTGKAK